MSGISKGFTLIEVIIVLAILSVVALVVVPNLGLQKPEQERKAVIAELNRLVKYAWNNALITNAIHRVVFDLQNHEIRVDMQTGKKDSSGADQYVAAQETYASTRMSWPEQMKIKNIIVEGFDELSKFSGGGATLIWFFIMPDGATQEVTINILDIGRESGKKAVRIGLVLNPFTAEFAVYDFYQK